MSRQVLEDTVNGRRPKVMSSSMHQILMILLLILDFSMTAFLILCMNRLKI